MLLDVNVLGLRWTVHVRREVRITGITSRVDGGGHILMWDFDDADRDNVVDSLAEIQTRFGLPVIKIVRTRDRGFHAYCFKRLHWAEVLRILHYTRLVDQEWLKLSAWRGYLTLRITDKPLAPHIEHELDLAPAFVGVYPDVSHNQLMTTARYRQAARD